MSMSWIKNKIKDFIWGGRQFPYPYIDCDGNELNSVEDIWVTSKEKLEEAIERGYCSKDRFRWNQEEMEGDWSEFLFPVDGLEWINGGVAFRNGETGERFDLKVGRKSLQILPFHALLAPQIICHYYGEVNTGKTLWMTQIICESGLFVSKPQDGTFCFTSDEIVDNPFPHPKFEAIKAYENNRLPEPTKKGELSLPYSFFVSYKTGEESVCSLVEFRDLAGEVAKEQGAGSVMFQSSYILFLISAHDLYDNEAKRNLIHLIQVFWQKGVQQNSFKGKLLVVFTKSDLFGEAELLQELLQDNTIWRYCNQLRLKKHADGYCIEENKKRNEVLYQYLNEEFPDVLMHLEMLAPQQQMEYFLIGSINQYPEDENVLPKNFCPYRIDEAILYLLADMGLYPYKEANDQEETEIEPEDHFQQYWDNWSGEW